MSARGEVKKTGLFKIIKMKLKNRQRKQPEYFINRLKAMDKKTFSLTDEF